MKKYLTSFPKLIAEWHPTKNGELNPQGFTHGSNTVVWWKCPLAFDHEWDAPIYSRVAGNGCPFCSGKLPSSKYNLQLTHPEIVEDWHPTANGELKPTQVTKGSWHEIYWQCKEVLEHVYPMTVYNRTAGKKCSYCAGQKVHKTNSLATHFPDIAKEWHPEKNGKKSPNDFTKASRAKVWWKCSKGDDHEWDATIKNRTIGKQGCAMCRGYRVCKDNSAVLLYPHLKKEWHPTKNEPDKLEEYTAFSNKYFWWRCFKGHEWKAPISSRSIGHNCDKCSPKTSRPEMRIFAEISALFSDSLHRKKIEGKELDVFIPSLKLGIEYDGYGHHRPKQTKRDLKKNKHFKDLEIDLIRMRGDGLKPLSLNDLITNNTILDKDDINQILIKIRTLVDIKFHQKIDAYLTNTNFLNDAVYLDLVTKMSIPDKGESLADKYPDVAKYWDFKKNIFATPEQFSPYSKDEVHWKCDVEDDHVWSAVITNMARDRQGNEICPFCNGRRPSERYNLAVTFPAVAQQWHPTANGDVHPTDITQGSDKKYYWLIDKKKVFRAVSSVVASDRRKRKKACD